MAADLGRSPPVPTKQTLVIVNDFIVNTTRFLNHFATLAEEKLQKVSSDIERVETNLLLLESRLSRVPGMEDARNYPPTAVRIELPTPSPPANQVAPSTATTSASVSQSLPMSQPAASGAAPLQPPAAPLNAVPTLGEDPNYGPFFKMLKMGVPAPAVKQKASLAGLDGAVLDMDPDGPSPFASGAGAGHGHSGHGSTHVAAATGSGATGGHTATGAQAVAAPPVPAAAAAVAQGPGMTVSEDPSYARFFKMLRMGVPAPAVKQKVSLAGLDPSVLDLDPNTPAR